MSTHECPARGCTERVRFEKVSCLKHWRLVPPDVQKEVYRSWRLKDMAAHRAAVLKAVKAMGALSGGG